MKKNAKRRITAAAAAAIIALTVPFAYAINYVGGTGTTGNTNNGLVGAAYTDVDNLFIYMMNQAMPVGTIYMTQSIPAAMGAGNTMEAKYGGQWVAWGAGRAPAGVNPGGTAANVLGAAAYQATYPAQAADATGGDMNDTTAQDFSFTPDLTLGGAGLALDEGSMTFSPGTIDWNGSMVINGPSGIINGTSTSIPVPAISHTHPYTIKGPSSLSLKKGDGDWHNSYWLSATSGTITLSTVGSSTSVQVPFSIDLSKWSPDHNLLPAINYTPKPEITYTRQNFQATNNLTLPASYFNATATTAKVSFANETVQPYEVVYMYKRTALADLNP